MNTPTGGTDKTDSSAGELVPKPKIEKLLSDGREREIISSPSYPIKKILYADPKTGAKYYSVIFLDPEDASVNVCVSSQIGCVEKCTFCATGDRGFKRNLSPAEIRDEITDGIGAFERTSFDKTCYIIMEGMGEPAVNIDNVLAGFEEAYSFLKEDFEKIVFRISSVGDLRFPGVFAEFVENKQNSMPNVEFQFQLSLHNAIEDERKDMIPGLSKRASLCEVLDVFYELADTLGVKLKCNYLLLDYPGGGNNYSDEHLKALIDVLDPEYTRIKLTHYSDTGKGFTSPGDDVYRGVSDFLTEHGIQNKVRALHGDDIGAACGMLDYE